jgi:hypothetical protein
LSLSWKDWKKTDIFYGIIAPLIVVLAIVGLSVLNSLIGYSESTGFIIGITMQILELTVIVAVPLLLGLVWNRWAGGASGFLMGSLYSLYWADMFRGGGTSGFNFGFGTILLAYTLSPMLIGYMAGALNKRSEDFRRMVLSGVTATAIGGVLLFGIFQLSPSNVVTGWDGFLLNVLPRILCGVLIPVIAKVFFWYGMGVNKRTKEYSA